jgi:hypothetical protein
LRVITMIGNSTNSNNWRRVSARFLEVLGKTLVSVEPGEGVFDHPAARQDDEALHTFRPKHSVGDPGVVFTRLDTQPMLAVTLAGPTHGSVC